MRTKSNSRTKWLEDIAGISFEDAVNIALENKDKEIIIDGKITIKATD